ncbi:MAG: hypothetical protein QXL38_01995 [Candidatus Bathyarchaeia archaeon]
MADGNWHVKEEILEETRLNPKQLETIISFLEEYGIVDVDSKKSSVRLNKNFRKVFEKETS